MNITILVSELNIWAKIGVFSNRDVRKWDHSYINEKLGQSYTSSQKKGAYRKPGSAEKGGYSDRTSVLVMSYIGSYPPPTRGLNPFILINFPIHIDTISIV